MKKQHYHHNIKKTPGLWQTLKMNPEVLKAFNLFMLQKTVLFWVQVVKIAVRKSTGMDQLCQLINTTPAHVLYNVLWVVWPEE